MPRLGFRKEPCGADKRKKRKKVQDFVKSQANAILPFVKPVTTSSIPETVATQRINDKDDDIGKVDPENLDKENDEQEEVDPVNLDERKENDEQEEVVYQSEEKKEHLSDPGNWGNVDMKLRNLLVKNGPTKRLSNDYQFPEDAIGRHFSKTFYTRDLVNGEKQDRRWLVYSKASDKVFCFCCKLFRHEKNGGGNLATTGYNDWKHLSTRLNEHERFHEHMICMTRWRELRVRLEKEQTIDKLFKRT